MFAVGMILSTQNLSDFKSAKIDYSSFIGSWIIHHVNNISRAEITNIFGAADNNYQGIWTSLPTLRSSKVSANSAIPSSVSVISHTSNSSRPMKGFYKHN